MKLKYEKPLSNFAFKCNLRHYSMVLLPLGEGRGEVPQESQRIALARPGPH